MDAIAVMDEAVMPFDSCTGDVNLLVRDLLKGDEYARGLPNNDITAQQWGILFDRKGNLLIGFLNGWKTIDKLSADYISIKKDPVSERFDAIIGLEAVKRKIERGIKWEHLKIF